ncbi:MAG: glutathione S-transferase N-terminal domain-containing protein [Proteobacteria bacterium]|nr:glutathione S-transferase N-terminal domain-containing protein [Pseudomonadota bacterium]
MLKIWGRRSSCNVQKIMWLLAELGIAHEHFDAGGRFGGLDDPKFRAMNPHGLVPVIDDGGTIIWESHACVRYLAAQYGKGTAFWNDDPRIRAEADKWMEWSATTLQRDAVDLFSAFWRTPEERHDTARIEDLKKRCANNFALLDDHLAARPYIAGDAITVADIAVGALLYRHFTLGFDWPKMPNLEAFYALMQERAPYRRHVMVSYDELRGMPR